MSLCKVRLPRAKPTLVLSRDVASACVSAGSVLHHCFPVRGVSWLLRGSRRPPQPAAGAAFASSLVLDAEAALGHSLHVQ